MTPALDFTDALRFGSLSFILKQDYKPEFFGDVFERISDSLKDVTDEDYFIPTGDPAIISLCAAEIVRRTGRINILRWDRTKQTYFSATAVYEETK